MQRQIVLLNKGKNAVLLHNRLTQESYRWISNQINNGLVHWHIVIALKHRNRKPLPLTLTILH